MEIMENKKWRIAFLIILILTFIALFSINSSGHFLESRAIIIQSTQSRPTPTPQWSLLDKITRENPELTAIQLKVGNTKIPYTEDRISRNDKGKITHKTIKTEDYEREIALELLSTVTGETEIIKIIKMGKELISPDGYKIEVVTRPSGITWNAWNTSYKVIEPENRIVTKNAYPSIKSEKTITETTTNKNGIKKKVKKKIPDIIETVIYVPYSNSLKIMETVMRGKEHLTTNIVQSARNLLDQRAVYSKAFPDKLITQVLPAEYYLRRPVIEQSDYGEFLLDQNGTVDRFLTIMGTNQTKAWSATCNKDGACGLYQFTDNGKNGTYRIVVKSFPSAQLIKDFELGSADQVNSAMAAMLLDDLNLAELTRRYGKEIINDPKLEEYLAASYNGAPKWVFKSLNATLGKNVEWGKHLRRETKEFLVKLRILKNDKLI